MWIPEVRKTLAKTDLVSVKVDSTIKSIWHAVNRPNEKLRLPYILEGTNDFAKMYDGKLLTETMLVKGVNDSKKNIQETADFIAKLNPSIALNFCCKS